MTVPANSSTGAFPVTISPSAVGTATISATYNGVTRSAVLTVTSQSLLRIVTPSPLPNARVGENYAGFIEACCGQGPGPIRWSLVSGTVPDGLRFAGDDLRLTQTTAVTGVATRVQTTTMETLQKQLGETVGQVNTVITTTLPGVYKQMHENNIYPGVGEPITIVRPTSTAQP